MAEANLEQKILWLDTQTPNGMCAYGPHAKYPIVPVVSSVETTKFNKLGTAAPIKEPVETKSPNEAILPPHQSTSNTFRYYKVIFLSVVGVRSYYVCRKAYTKFIILIFQQIIRPIATPI